MFLIRIPYVVTLRPLSTGNGVAFSIPLCIYLYEYKQRRRDGDDATIYYFVLFKKTNCIVYSLELMYEMKKQIKFVINDYNFLETIVFFSVIIYNYRRDIKATLETLNYYK